MCVKNRTSVVLLSKCSAEKYTSGYCSLDNGCRGPSELGAASPWNTALLERPRAGTLAPSGTELHSWHTVWHTSSDTHTTWHTHMMTYSVCYKMYPLKLKVGTIWAHQLSRNLHFTIKWMKFTHLRICGLPKDPQNNKNYLHRYSHTSHPACVQHILSSVLSVWHKVWQNRFKLG